MADKVTEDWQLYLNGVDFKNKLNLYDEVNKAWRFYVGDHWKGVTSNGLPTLMFNILKRVIQYKVSSLNSSPRKITYVAEGIDESQLDGDGKKMNEAAALLTDFAETTWERLSMSNMLEDGTLDAALSGDMAAFFWWDPDVDAGDGVQGEMEGELIDNTNIFLGNPNSPVINTKSGKPKQPYVMISSRKIVQEVRDEARANGVAEDLVNGIVGDSENQNQSGDMSKIELQNDKVLCLLKMWYNRKTKTIWARKSTQYVVYSKDGDQGFDTGNKRYPAAMMNYERRKGCCHGVSDAYNIIPNNIAFNKVLSMMALSVHATAWPKAIYNADVVQGWTNAVGSAIAVKDMPANMALNQVAQYLTPGTASFNADKLIGDIATYTKEMMGANDTVLGNVNPQNTSAIMLIQKQTAIPLQSIDRRMNDFVRDIGLIWADFWMTKYRAPRKLAVRREQPALEQQQGVPPVGPMPQGKKVRMMVPFNAADYEELRLGVNVEVGPSTEWNEAIQQSHLEKLLTLGAITIKQYLERVSDAMVPKREELINEIEQDLMRQGMQAPPGAQGGAAAQGAPGAPTGAPEGAPGGAIDPRLYNQVAEFISTLPPEEQAILEEMRKRDPQRYEMAVRELIRREAEQERQREAQEV